MKKCMIILFAMLIMGTLKAQTEATIALLPPDTSRGLPLMKALWLRASATEFDTADLSLRDLSDLLWAANGINRPGNGKRTAPSAVNAQDIDVYVVMKNAAYRYNPLNHSLDIVAAGDYRFMVAGRQTHFAKAPLFCVLVSDYSKFPFGDEDQRLVWASEDAGIVSQNISIFCAATGLATRPRASMDLEKLGGVLKLKDTQHLVLNSPVSYIRR